MTQRVGRTGTTWYFCRSAYGGNDAVRVVARRRWHLRARESNAIRATPNPEHWFVYTYAYCVFRWRLSSLCLRHGEMRTQCGTVRSRGAAVALSLRLLAVTGTRLFCRYRGRRLDVKLGRFVFRHSRTKRRCAMTGRHEGRPYCTTAHAC